MQAVEFEAVLERIVTADPRYHREAYLFLRESLSFTQKLSAKHRESVRDLSVENHVSGQQLLEGIRQFALEQFGPMTKSVLNEWGINTCEDFGEIVFNLVEHDLLRKTEQDSRADFKGGYDFFEAFRKPYLPEMKSAPALTDGQAP